MGRSAIQTMITFERTFPSLTESDLEAVEDQIGIALPSDLRAHYALFNGGKPIPNFFSKDNEWYEIQEFLPMRTNRHSAFESTYDSLVKGNKFFPKQTIPFAADDSGDYFLYSLSKESFGHIFFNQHEYFSDPSRFIIFLSSSFSDFLRSLTEYREN